MIQQTKIEFDELDLKCLTEMPLILEVISSTGNRVARLFESLYPIMREMIQNDLKSEWRINNRASYECKIFPFTRENKPAFSIDSFETRLKIESAVSIEKVVNEKVISFFWPYFAYECEVSEKESTHAFYFSVEKTDNSEKLGGILNALEFYKKIKTNLKDYKIVIEHPEKGDDHEYIALYVEDFSVEKIKEGFNVFCESILKPFLKSLK